MAYRIECVLECRNHLGEGPVWDVGTGVLWWLDGTGRRVGNPSIWRLEPKTGRVDNWFLDHDVGALAVRENGKLVLALDRGFYFFDPATGALERIALIEADQPRSRLNDGKVDRRGRFIAGGMDDKEELAMCGLWRLDPDLTVTRVEEGIICTNGPCWSPDDRTFYVADTFVDEFWAYDYDADTGSLSNKARLRRYQGGSRGPGRVDGGCRGLSLERGTDLRRPGSLRSGRQRGAQDRASGQEHHVGDVRRRRTG